LLFNNDFKLADLIQVSTIQEMQELTNVKNFSICTVGDAYFCYYNNVWYRLTDNNLILNQLKNLKGQVNNLFFNQERIKMGDLITVPSEESLLEFTNVNDASIAITSDTNQYYYYSEEDGIWYKLFDANSNAPIDLEFRPLKREYKEYGEHKHKCNKHEKRHKYKEHKKKYKCELCDEKLNDNIPYIVYKGKNICLNCLNNLLIAGDDDNV